MIEVFCEDGVFEAIGSFSLGIAGTFVNEDFEFGNPDMITIKNFIPCDADLDPIFNNRLSDLDDIVDEEILPFIKSDKLDDIADGLTEYINQKQDKIAENVKQINDSILYDIFCGMYGGGDKFWDLGEPWLPKYLDNFDEDEFRYVYFQNIGRVRERYECFKGTPNDGTIEKPDVEAVILDCFPMFNLDSFIFSFKPKQVCFDGRFTVFEFCYGDEPFLGRRGRLDGNLTYT